VYDYSSTISHFGIGAENREGFIYLYCSIGFQWHFIASYRPGWLYVSFALLIIATHLSTTVNSVYHLGVQLEAAACLYPVLLAFSLGTRHRVGYFINHDKKNVLRIRPGRMHVFESAYAA
jgi:hypothetical protein